MWFRNPTSFKMTKLTLLCILVTNIVLVADGLQCYSCTYSKIGGTEAGESACLTADSLTDSLLVDCPSPKNDQTSGSRGSRQNQILGCGEFRARGELDYDGGSGSAVTRGCVDLSGVQTPESKCTSKILKAWWDEGSQWAGYVSGQVSRLGAYNRDVRVEACFCLEDRCNNKSGVGSVKIGMVIVGSLLVSMKKYIEG